MLLHALGAKGKQVQVVSLFHIHGSWQLALTDLDMRVSGAAFMQPDS